MKRHARFSPVVRHAIPTLQTDDDGGPNPSIRPRRMSSVLEGI